MNHLECVTSKNNQWYWYLLVVFLCFIASQTVGSVPLLLVLLWSFIKNGFADSDLTALTKMDFNTMGIDLNLTFACILFGFAVFFITAIFCIKLIHGRSWQQVINGTSKVRWSRFFFGFIVWGVISLVMFAVSYMMEPEALRFRFEPVNFFILLVLAVIFIPIQASSEEFLFRGYITQGFASWTKNRWLALLIPSLLFGLMHSFNPEIKEYGYWPMMTQYVLLGLLLGFMTLMDDGIELAMGVHTVNNLFGSVLITFKGSALQTYALFEATEINPAKEILPLVVTGIVILAIFAAKYNWNFNIINQKVSLPYISITPDTND